MMRDWRSWGVITTWRCVATADLAIAVRYARLAGEPGDSTSGDSAEFDRTVANVSLEAREGAARLDLALRGRFCYAIVVDR